LKNRYVWVADVIINLQPLKVQRVDAEEHDSSLIFCMGSNPRAITPEKI
jgi:hypothetical protein